MRLSVVIADERAPENAFVVWRGFESSIRKAARMGYDGVEIALGVAQDIDVPEANRLLRVNGLTVSCISTGLTFAKYGLYMTDSNPERRARVVEVFRDLTLLAAGWGGMINVGRARGFIAPTQTRADAEELFFESMAKIAPFAAEHGVTILIEPINRYESNFLNSVDDAVAILRRMPHENLGVMADVFHMNIEDDHIDGSLIRNADYVRYVHLADSNRLAPGWGHTDFGAILRALKSVGYDGWLSAEILKGADPDRSAEQTAAYVRRLMVEVEQEGCQWTRKRSD